MNEYVFINSRLTRRNFLRLSVIAASAVTFLGCQPVQPAPAGVAHPIEIRYATGGAMPPTEIEIAIFSEPMQKNVLRHYGKEYTFQLIMTKGTPEAQSLLIAEQADLATLAFSTISTTVIKNAVPGGISVIAGQYVDGFPGFGTNAYLILADSGIKSASDLKGKTVGVNAIGSAVDIILRSYLQQNDIDPVTDVEFVEVGFGAMGAALREKRIDLGSFVQPFQAIEQNKGGVQPLFLSTDAIQPYSPIATVARNQFLQEHPDAVRAFLEDWYLGLTWLSNPDNHAQAIQIMSNISKTPVEVLDLFFGKRGIDYYRNPLACPSVQALQVGVDAMVTQKLLVQPIDIASLTNTSFLPKPCQ